MYSPSVTFLWVRRINKDYNTTTGPEKSNNWWIWKISAKNVYRNNIFYHAIIHKRILQITFHASKLPVDKSIHNIWSPCRLQQLVACHTKWKSSLPSEKIRVTVVSQFKENIIFTIYAALLFFIMTVIHSSIKLSDRLQTYHYNFTI